MLQTPEFNKITRKKSLKICCKSNFSTYNVIIFTVLYMLLKTIRWKVRIAIFSRLNKYRYRIKSMDQ